MHDYTLMGPFSEGIQQRSRSSNISNMRDSVSSGYPNEKRVQKNDAQRSIFDEMRGVWMADETQSQVYDRSSQQKKRE